MHSKSLVLTRVLSDRQDALLREERALLMRLRTALARIDAAAEQQEALDQSIAQLDELFLLVVVGEFNAGKSAFINALIGQPLMKEGVTPTTAVITVLEHGDQPEQTVRQANLLVIKAPIDLLREIRIVDTPGTNAIIREHETMTAEFIPRSDLVFFVTSADRPFTETERGFMEHIRGWGKKIVVVVNKSDILEGPAQVAEIRSFVADNARSLLGFEPEIFFVSAKLALRAKRGEPAVWAASGFEALESYVATTLNASGRAQLKLLNPLGVAMAVAERQRGSLRDRQALLKDDVATLEQVESQLGLYQRDMERDFDLRMADVENVLLEMERRGNQFFDDTMRIGRVMDLLNRSRVQEAFERQVVADAPQQIERKVGELIDWMIDADLRHWQGVTAHLAKRRQQYAGQLIDNPDTERFHFDRRRMIDSVGREAQKVVDSYDRQREASELADGARNAVATAAAVGAECGGPRCHRDDCRIDCCGRRDGARHGLGDRRDWFLRDSRQTQEGQGRDAEEDRRGAAAPRRCAESAVQEGDRAGDRAHPHQHRPLQPLRPRRGREARIGDEGARDDCFRPVVAWPNRRRGVATPAPRRQAGGPHGADEASRR